MADSKFPGEFNEARANAKIALRDFKKMLGINIVCAANWSRGKSAPPAYAQKLLLDELSEFADEYNHNLFNLSAPLYEPRRISISKSEFIAELASLDISKSAACNSLGISKGTYECWLAGRIAPDNWVRPLILKRLSKISKKKS